MIGHAHHVVHLSTQRVCASRCLIASDFPRQRYDKLRVFPRCCLHCLVDFPRDGSGHGILAHLMVAIPYVRDLVLRKLEKLG